jgi:hypothetical protein
VLVASCQSDTPSTASCAVTQQSAFPASPLMLLGEVRLDLTGSTFLLIGNDGDTVRWAKVDPISGQLGTEHAYTVAAHGPGLWYAAAGAQAPADTILVAAARVAANGSDVQVDVTPVAADGSGSAQPGPPVVVFPGAAAATSAPNLVLGSSRSGMAAGLGWVDSSSGTVMFTALGGDGQPAAPAAATVDTPSQVLCLGFVPGQDELTLGYYELPASGGGPQWLTVEAREDGSIAGSLFVTLASTLSVCPKVAATTGGYAYAWQDPSGSWLGLYATRSNRINDYPFVDAFYFGGADLQPPIAGLGPIGSDYAVIFAGAASAELWRLDSSGVRQPGALVFPSMSGNLGPISAQPSAGSLYATYADYSDATAASGQRFFLKATCF